MKIIIGRFNNPVTGKEAGAVLSIESSSIKKMIGRTAVKNLLIDYAFNSLYPGEKLTLFRGFYPDRISILVLRLVKELNYQQIETDL